ncbi:MarR family winged helix-turn-helix transcriptional regulator [Streptomyces sp. NPDC052092]|uniref:MarR family winged helix-turn-helix transcriptional regulator n=1 Tax=Streptomyces sp. NPDC052092 TaxID=3365685 RepID=UPI0037CDE40F
MALEDGRTPSPPTVLPARSNTGSPALPFPGPRGYFILAAAVRGEARSQRFLADRLGADRAMMSSLLDDLEEAGLVERTPDPTDRRNRRIVATPRGAESYEVLPAEVSEIDGLLLPTLSGESRASFREMKYAIARGVRANKQTASDGGAAELAGVEKPTRAVRRKRSRSKAQSHRRTKTASPLQTAGAW